MKRLMTGLLLSLRLRFLMAKFGCEVKHLGSTGWPYSCWLPPPPRPMGGECVRLHHKVIHRLHVTLSVQKSQPSTVTSSLGSHVLLTRDRTPPLPKGQSGDWQHLAETEGTALHTACHHPRPCRTQFSKATFKSATKELGPSWPTLHRAVPPSLYYSPWQEHASSSEHAALRTPNSGLPLHPFLSPFTPPTPQKTTATLTTAQTAITVEKTKRKDCALYRSHYFISPSLSVQPVVWGKDTPRIK